MTGNPDQDVATSAVPAGHGLLTGKVVVVTAHGPDPADDEGDVDQDERDQDPGLHRTR